MIKRKGWCRKGDEQGHTRTSLRQGLKLAKEIGTKRAAEELGVPKNTLGTWVHKTKKGEVDPGKGEQTAETALTLAAENQKNGTP